LPFRTRLQARAAVHKSWANTTDRTARTAAAREAAWEKLLREVDPDGAMTPDDRDKAAKHLRRSGLLAAAKKSVDSRARKKATKKQAGGEAP
jgi:hypothetical protein